MSIKYEPSSEPLHIYVKALCLQVSLYQISAAQLAPQDALPIGFTVTAAHTEVPIVFIFAIPLFGMGATRAEDAQGTPTQSRISPSMLVNEG